jgi:hypothetical protein
MSISDKTYCDRYGGLSVLPWPYQFTFFNLGDERENGGLRQKRAKEMTLVLQSKVDDQDQREIPIQVQAAITKSDPIQV